METHIFIQWLAPIFFIIGLVLFVLGFKKTLPDNKKERFKIIGFLLMLTSLIVWFVITFVSGSA